jgi:hypothetical protein
MQKVVLISTGNYPMVLGKSGKALILPPALFEPQFEKAGYKLESVENLDELPETAAAYQPAAIILQLDALYYDEGMYICRNLKSSILTNSIPLIVYGVFDSIRHINEAYQIGVSFVVAFSSRWEEASHDEMVAEISDITLKLIDTNTSERQRITGKGPRTRNEYLGNGLNQSPLNN